METDGHAQPASFEETHANDSNCLSGAGARSSGIGNEAPGDDSIRYSHHHRQGGDRNIEIDWREVDPYFSELSDCASFWTLINFTCDVIYSGLFVLFFIMGQDVQSMFFEGLLNHINPILLYLIFSLVINYGALKALRCGRERCFLIFSISKGLLFPITMFVLLYLIFCDVQDYFGTFWVSFVVIISCYNLTAALGLWSMFTCNRYILINEAAQKRIRKEGLHLKPNNENSCRCSCAPEPQQLQSNASGQNCTTIRSGPSHHQTRKVGDSSATHAMTMNENFCEPILKGISKKDQCCRILDGDISSLTTNFASGSCLDGSFSSFNSSKLDIPKRESSDDEILSFGEDDEVLQISTVHKMLQEIRLIDAKKKLNASRDVSDDGESL